jgi:hypothetical protein
MVTVTVPMGSADRGFGVATDTVATRELPALGAMVDGVSTVTVVLLGAVMFTAAEVEAA